MVDAVVRQSFDNLAAITVVDFSSVAGCLINYVYCTHNTSYAAEVSHTGIVIDTAGL
ncbi:hypothetical protein [Turicimonas muris]|uniref:hypothetical protein n=1 Tax=Turicimonas muris TaxID=1796652 RepID=UPI0026761274|nr:hypothetical protein [Turicimonas muris]